MAELDYDVARLTVLALVCEPLRNHERDSNGQIVIYTGIYLYADGTYHDVPEDEEEDEPCQHGDTYVNDRMQTVCCECGEELGR